MVSMMKKEFPRILCKIIEFNEIAPNIIELTPSLLEILKLNGLSHPSNYGPLELKENSNIKIQNGLITSNFFANKLRISLDDYLELIFINGSLYLIPILARNLFDHFYQKEGVDTPSVIVLSSHAEFEPFTREIATGIHNKLKILGISSLRIELKKQILQIPQKLDITISRYEVDITRNHDEPEIIAKKLVNKNRTYRPIAKTYFDILLSHLSPIKNCLVLDIHGIAKMSPFGFESPLLIIGDAKTKNPLIRKLTKIIKKAFSEYHPKPRIVYHSRWGYVEYSLKLVEAMGNIPIIIEIRRDLRDDSKTRENLINSISNSIKAILDQLDSRTYEKITYHAFQEKDIENLYAIYLTGYSDLYGNNVKAHADLFIKLLQEGLLMDLEGEIFITEKNGTQIGFASIHQDNSNNWQFGPLIVLPLYQREGIGSTLLKLCIQFAQSKKAEQITLKVHEHNEIAIYLYKKFGFITIETIPSNLQGIKYFKMALTL